MIVIVDYGMGNLLSVHKAFKRVGYAATITSDPSEILKAEKLVLPGVGHFKSGMDHLRERKLIEPLNQKVLLEGTPIIGICLGMQLMTEQSEEGNVKGLGWFKAKTVLFNLPKDNRNLRVPHMGWNSIRPSYDDTLMNDIPQKALFYFVHSYYVTCDNPEEILATTEYGAQFVSAIHKKNIFGVQFHPEKSHDNGLKIIKNFAEKIPSRQLSDMSTR